MILHSKIMKTVAFTVWENKIFRVFFLMVAMATKDLTELKIFKSILIGSIGSFLWSFIGISWAVSEDKIFQVIVHGPMGTRLYIHQSQ